MNHSTSNDSKIRPEGCPSKPVSSLADLQVKTFEDRVRERLKTKYPTHTPAEARRLEEQIEKLVQIYAEGRILLQGDRSGCVRRNRRPQRIEQTREIQATDEWE
jgi:hypothetical protein